MDTSVTPVVMRETTIRVAARTMDDMATLSRIHHRSRNAEIEVALREYAARYARTMSEPAEPVRRTARRMPPPLKVNKKEDTRP